MTILIRDKKIGKDQPTYVIAEMACAHNGEVKQALQLVDVAAESGADAIQLQMFSVEDYITPHHPAYEVVANIELKPKEWEKIIKRVRQHKIDLFVAAYDKPSLDLAVANGVDGFKIHSSDLSNPYLTEQIASHGQPITLSTGASTIEEIAAAVDFLKKAGSENIILMHGYQSFPTKIEDTNLHFISYLKERFGLSIGYQDHTDGEDVLTTILPLVALGFHVDVIEKHYNLDRSKKGIDHQSSLNPDELKHFVRHLRRIEKSIGQKQPHSFSDDELKYRQSAKKSIVAARNIEIGTIIAFEDLMFARSIPGLPPTEAPRIIGKKTKKTLKKHDNIFLEDTH